MIEYNHDAAITEASRCLMCNDAPCHAGCPSSVNPKKFIRRIRFEDLAGAVRLLREANVLAGSCSYICPCQATCCANCTSEKLGRPIDISGLQRFVIDWERLHGMIEPTRPVQNGKKVAVVGSGPAGLSCAARLAAKGYKVDILERENVIGGQLALSIPKFRLPDEVLNFDIEFVKKLGVAFHLKTEVKDTKALKHDAVFVAAGLTSSKKLDIKGKGLKGVYDALDFLMRSRRGEKFNLGRRVLVIGGGDTALDAARVAVRGGTSVLMLYRRTQKDMPAYRPEIEAAFSEGVELWFRVVPVEVIGRNCVEGLKVRRVLWKGEGRRAKEYTADGPDFEIKADTIINAVGQEKAFSLSADKGTFAGGDFANGPGTAVAAVADGSRVADEIDKYLNREASVQITANNGPAYFSAQALDLSIKFCGIKFENPFVLAAAPPTDELEMLQNGLKAGWAGAVLKTTSVTGTPVNLKYPMMSGINYDGNRLVSMGNIDLISEHHIDIVEKRVQKLKEQFPNKVIIASIMGSEKRDWQSLVTRLSDAGADMIECSFSCPQGSLGAKPGQMLAQDVGLTKTVASWVKEAASRHKRNLPVVIKITPHVADIAEVAAAVKEAGADAVCASNTIQSLMGIDLDTWVPNPNVGGLSTYSGMSGPAIRPITLKVISEIARKVGIPIAGTGGPVSWHDAVEFMLCGAGIVQFCTAVMHYGYDIIDDLKDGLSNYLRTKNLKGVQDLIGGALPFIVSHEELAYKKRIISRIDLKKCIKDDLCYIACRDGGHMAISVNDKREPSVDDEKCVGCGLCSIICPVSDCIEMKKK